ncbi:uncharacterized protein LOC119644216 isoform X2 [Glossina fuscipes]|uniref:Uncharacterized protein LOC119644216 isoform X2 n=1 Tax=Glossina fuscipes TaxID=7396 RepID=A0A9C5ZMN9_9MUSC|nr:uncharacterized protein LOC119644216 isoform X2 [Glossina fuscipes]
MNSTFGEVFMFLTNLAWKSRLAIPVLVTTAFLIMDIRLQIEINLQFGQAAAADLDQLADNSDDDDDDNTNGDVDYEEYTTDSQDEDENEYTCLINSSLTADGVRMPKSVNSKVM